MKNKTPNLPDTLTWKAHIHTHRSPRWYIGFGLFAIALMAFAILYDKSITAVITFALILIVVNVVHQGSRTVVYKIGKTGLIAGNTLYPYKIIKMFWLHYHPPEVKRLNFETSAYLNNRISFELGDQDPVLVKLVLSQYLPEDLEREESLREALARRLKI